MNKTEKLGHGLSPEDLEKLRKIQEQEDVLYGKQGQLSFQVDEIDSDTESLLDNSEDPALNKKLFYRLQSIINSNIKKGSIRDFINNEKKLYLKSISNSGDSRFSFKDSLNKLQSIADDWQHGDTNGFDLGMAYYNLNEKEGFHKPEKIKHANLPFDTILKAALKVPPPQKD